MAMDAKDLRAESALAERSSDGGAKYTHTAAALHYERGKQGQEVASNSFKVDGQGTRPCAVIGPDRVAPPPRDAFPKKAPVEPWLGQDTVYRRPPEYPHKVVEYQDPTRNISPRQTFQENMQRIIMPPGYNVVKLNEDPTYASKSTKLNVPAEVKYYDVPYNVNPMSSDQKNSRNVDHSVSNVNPLLVKNMPHGWPPGSVNVRPLRQYGAPEIYQYSDFGSCAGPRPTLTRHHTGHEEPSQLYPDPYYHDANIRFKPYPNIKERYPQARYEYLGNFPNPYHPPHPFATHKYELPKSMPPHPYPGYPQAPLKYTDRMSEPVMDGYQRSFNQQGNYGVPLRNPVIHPTYRPGPGNTLQSKMHPYPPDGPNKAVISNKLPYDPNNKVHVDYDTRPKAYPVSDNYYLNEMSRPYLSKNQIILPNYPPGNIHGVGPPPHPYYLKENIQMKNFEYAQLKNLDPSILNNSLTKLPMQFSPSTLAISPADSNASNETGQTHGTPQDDCGYFSQSSVTSVRSIDSVNRIPMDPYGRPDYRYGPIIRSSPQYKPDPNCNQVSKTKKDIRQFISSWSEGDDEIIENSSSKDNVKIVPVDTYNYSKHTTKNQEELYVLGLVNVPREELSKYEHIQKVSKLPKNIKGYNSLELLNQFEEAIESSNMANIEPTKRDGQIQQKNVAHKQDTLPRAVSPLDVEAKISQSVIHKDVGCNFEIKPCSPKMLNVEVAAPVQTVLNERVIEKVANPLNVNVKSPLVLQSVTDENMENILNTKTIKHPLVSTSSSCKMINRQMLSEPSVIDNLKTCYSLHDLESNSGVCLASLPRLDNDIELSFPEVNQQFINANKTEPLLSTATSFSKDLPALDTERSESNTTNNSVASAEYDIHYQFSPKTRMETDKEFSRLSKYRKLKKNIADGNETTQQRAQATRVDSVIIKNPDNVRIHEESTDALFSGSYLRKDDQEFAINLASQAKNSEAMCQSDIDKKCVVSNKHKEIENYSANNVELYPKADNLLHRTCSVETIQNSEFEMQSQDLSMTYRDLSNRYLEKAALEMPMNLSPQARYSTIDTEEDAKSGKHCSNKHKNTKMDSEKNLESSDDNQTKKELKRKIETEIKTCETLKESPLKYQNGPSLSTTQLTETLTVSKSEQENDVTCNNLNLSKENSEIIINSLSYTEKQDLNVSSCDRTDIVPSALALDEIEMKSSSEPVIDKVQNVQTLDLNTEINHVSNCLQEDKIVFEGKISTNENCQHIDTCIVNKSLQGEINLIPQKDKIKHKNELSIPKLKKNKNKLDGTRRKRSTENHSSYSENDIISTGNKKPKLKLPSNSTNEMVRKSRLFGSKMKSLNATVEKKTEINTLDVLNEKDNEVIQRDIDLSVQVEEENMEQCVLDSNKNGENTTPGIKNNQESLTDTLNKELSPKTIGNDNTDIVSKKENNVMSVNTVNAVHENHFLTDLSLSKSLITNNDSSFEESIMMAANQASKNEIVQKLGTSLLSNVSLTEGERGPTICQESNLMQSKIEKTFPVLDTLNEKYNISDERFETDSETNTDQTKVKKRNDLHFYLKGYVRKELFSPRFQNLLTFNEEVSTLARINVSESTREEPETQMKCTNSLDSTSMLYDHDQQNRNCSDPTDSVDVIENKENRTKDYLLPETNEQNLNDQHQENVFKSDILEHFGNETKENIEIQDEDGNCKKDHDEMLNLNIDHESSNCVIVNQIGQQFNNRENNVLNFTTMLNEKPVISESGIELHEKNTVDQSSNLEFSISQTDISKTHISADDSQLKSLIQEKAVCQNKIESPNMDLANVDDSKKEQRYNLCERPRFSLKRSLSDSALDAYDGDADESTMKRCFMLPKKRNKCYNSSNIDESHLLNMIQNSRRNSISTTYNENNISFCILIDDDCIIAEENFEHEESNFTELQNEPLNQTQAGDTSDNEKCGSPIVNRLGSEERNLDTDVSECDLEKSWVEDVGYEEVIETEDIAENIVIGEPATPKDTDSSDYESDDGDMGILNSAAVDHTNKVKHIYGDNMCINDAQLVDALYRTPQMDVNKKLMDRESQKTEKSTKYYDSDSLEMLLAEPINNYQRLGSEPEKEFDKLPSSIQINETPSDSKENDTRHFDESANLVSDSIIPATVSDPNIASPRQKLYDILNDSKVDSCESSLDNVFNYVQKEDSSYTSSSPEVSSTTSEEKNSSILLKISSYKGSRISEVKDLRFDNRKENSCKFTEKEYLNPNYNTSLTSHRPLITKAAQKYIPPIKEPIPDLRVQLPLPQQSLMKFQKNKVSKEEPKLSTRNVCCNNNNVHLNKDIPKKVKPKFEDVLKNIDKVQLQKHKEKNKKSRKYVPKVVIKKSENGSHYASTSAKDPFNPDLTGRKWQPWVFIEKNHLIDKMALRNKTMAVFSHRKKTYVLAEKFCKYKSISSAKFIISQPSINDFPKGNLKYTIKLKHGH
ncbi:uncharacterized protein [Choristoneura fumiferana]|uniref:uncharacterized protein n=1 Tax=Choristoneura fumiferana TaxID=7141 RepID=UPI003D15E4EC